MLNQIEAMVSVAKVCGARLVVFSSLLNEYPKEFLANAHARAGEDLLLLMPTRGELDRGYRERPDKPQIWEKIDRLLPDKSSAEMEPKFAEPRFVKGSDMLLNFGS
jgi:hypothetical protein